MQRGRFHQDVSQTEGKYLKLASDVCLLQSGDQPTHEDLTAVANELLQLEDTIAKEDQKACTKVTIILTMSNVKRNI